MMRQEDKTTRKRKVANKKRWSTRRINVRKAKRKHFQDRRGLNYLGVTGNYLG